MRIRKEVIRPGAYHYRDKVGVERLLAATPEFIQYLHDNGNAMRAANIPIPVPLEHDSTAHPLTPAEKLLNNSGEVDDFEIADLVEKDKTGKDVTVKGVLFSNVEIKKPEALKGIHDGTIRWTSPAFDSFTDSTGKPWKSVITHLALTTRPVLHNQQPFQANLSLTPSSPSPQSSLLDGCCLSRAGVVSESQPGVFSPVYPVAFSLWSGAKLAFPPKEEDGGGEDEKKKKPEGKEGEEGKKPEGGDGEKKPPFGDKGSKDGDMGSKPKFDPMTGQPIKESLVDPDGDINVWCVIADMASMALGVDIGDEEITAENGPEKLLEILRNAVRDKIAAADMGNKGPNMPEPPPATPPAAGNPKPKNPIIQEQQPMFMSLTRAEAEALPDTRDKQIALSLVATRERAEASEKRQKALEQKLFNDAKIARDRRIAKVMRVMPDDVRAQLTALSAGAQFSLSDDGTISDPMEPWLKLYERQQELLPSLLRDHAAELSIAAQPEETTGAVPAEQMKKVREEFLRNAGLAKA